MTSTQFFDGTNFPIGNGREVVLQRRENDHQPKTNEKSIRMFTTIDFSNLFVNRFRFDSPPKEHAALPKAALPTAEMLYTMYGTGTNAPFHLGSQIDFLLDINPNEMSKRILMLNQVQQAQTAKSDRKLYIGNLPPNMTPELVLSFSQFSSH